MNEAKKVPVIIGFASPFRLVARNGDTWQPTDEQISNRTYDYVKLHRLSTFLDADIRPFSLAIGFDGSLILPAITAYRDRGTASKKFNDVLGQLLLGGLYSEAVSPEDVVFGRLTLDGYFSLSTCGTGAESGFHFGAHSTYLGPLDMARLLRPPVITVDELSHAFEVGKSILTTVPRLSSSTLLSGVTYYVRHQWAEALVMLWTAIEQVVSHIWDEQVIDQNLIGQNVFGRREFLSDHRTWPVSTRVEMFFQRSLIADDDYNLINVARKARNDFIHRGASPTQSHVEAAASGLFHLLSRCTSEYRESNRLEVSLQCVEKHVRGEVIPERRTYLISEATHWLPSVPVPGDSNWGDRLYEVIPELCLKEIEC